MLPNVKTGAGEARLILSALLVWSVSALALLCVTAFALTKLSAGEGAMGYISSALSFLNFSRSAPSSVAPESAKAS